MPSNQQEYVHQSVGNKSIEEPTSAIDATTSKHMCKMGHATTDAGLNKEESITRMYVSTN